MPEQPATEAGTLRDSALDASFTGFFIRNHLDVETFLQRLEADRGMVEDVYQRPSSPEPPHAVAGRPALQTITGALPRHMGAEPPSNYPGAGHPRPGVRPMHATTAFDSTTSSMPGAHRGAGRPPGRGGHDRLAGPGSSVLPPRWVTVMS
ncbi:hypothetical protein GCM10020358_55730 [Amorphoplanes nipponensis]